MVTRFNEFDTVYAPPGEAIDDGGATYSSIQNAVDNADDWVLVGPGTYDQEVLIQNGETVIGRGAVMDPTNVSFNVEAVMQLEGSDSTVIGFEFASTDFAKSAIKTFGDGHTIRNITVLSSESFGLDINSTDTNVRGCFIENTSNDGMSLETGSVIGCTVRSPNGQGITYTGSPGTVIGMNRVINPSNNGIASTSSGENAGPTIVGNQIKDAGNNGMLLETDPAPVVGNYILNPSSDGIRVRQTGNHYSFWGNTFVNVSGQNYNIGGDGYNVVNGRYAVRPVADLGGTSGSISPEDNNLQTYDIEVGAGGSPVNLEGIDGIAEDSVMVRLYHTGGETITLEHKNGNATNPLYLQGEQNADLSSNGQLVTFIYGGNAWREVSSNLVT
jgi:hypothetical protein